jgi:SET domain-containing protein
MCYRPLPDSLTIKKSRIEGLGLFAKEFIKKETELGISHYYFEDDLIRTPLGGFYNHSDAPNCYSKTKVTETGIDEVILITGRDIQAGEEITTYYIIQPLPLPNHDKKHAISK